MGNRHGKHRDGLVSVGLYMDEDSRALLALVVDQTGDTVTNILMEGIRERATKVGIMQNGAVVPKFVPVLEVIKEAFRFRKMNRRTSKKEGV